MCFYCRMRIFLIIIIISLITLTNSFSQNSKAKIAILIDDVGARTSTLTTFFQFNEKITFAVLPFLAKSKECNKIIQNSDYKSILHMPMESKNNKTLNERTKGMIKTGMSKQQIDLLLDSAIVNIGEKVDGFNNHIGSKFTSNAQSMFYLLSLAKQKELFFIDSNTYNRIGEDGVISNPEMAFSYKYARGLGIKTSFNSLFIDNLNTLENVEKVLLSAIDLAKEKGELIIIGHYRKNTANALNNVKNKMLAAGIEFVFVDELLE